MTITTPTANAAAESALACRRLYCAQCATGWPCGEQATLKRLRDAGTELTTTTLPATVKDAAAAIRQDLKAAFPGAKFSVRKGTGTNSAWIDVTWTDGPNDDMVRNVTDPYLEFGSPVDGVSPDRRLSKAVLLQAQEQIRAALPEFAVYDANGRYVLDGPGECPVFHLGGWRFGGGDRYSALAGVADLLILNPRTGPGA